MAKEKFIIEPHFRLQEWVAEEKGYFKDEGLDYDFPGADQVDRRRSTITRATRSARCRSFEKGRKSDVSCACHWTVDVAASKGNGQLYGDVYSVSPSGVFVPADSPSRRRRTSPACRSRSATSRAATTRPSRRSSSTCRPTRSISRFADGMLFHRARPVDRGQGAGVRAVQRARITSPSSSASARSSTRPS